ncbi:MAG: DUF1350 family protein [Phormidesmis sp.]
MSSTASFRFRPHANSWVALHPQPKGIVQFMGGAFFGTYPTLFYRQLLKQFYNEGYTVIALPFSFTFDHWRIALTLLQEHYTLRHTIIEAAQRQGYETDVYLDAANYCWLGHSLGCKYIAMLELLSSPQDIFEAYADGVGIELPQLKAIAQSLQALTQTLRQLENNIQSMTGKAINYGQPSIYNEASLLMAPTIADLNGAIPWKPLEKLLSKILKVAPTVEQTHTLIQRSKLFNVTHIVEFADDKIAKSTCDRLKQEQPHITHGSLPGKHLTPMGFSPAGKLSPTTASHKKAVSALTQLQANLQKQPKPQTLNGVAQTPHTSAQTAEQRSISYAALISTKSSSILAS